MFVTLRVIICKIFQVLVQNIVLSNLVLIYIALSSMAIAINLFILHRLVTFSKNLLPRLIDFRRSGVFFSFISLLRRLFVLLLRKLGAEVHGQDVRDVKLRLRIYLILIAFVMVLLAVKSIF